MLSEDENLMPDLLGRNIGQYQLIESLGKGDTSHVYKAFQPAMSRYVAVKVLFPSLAALPRFVEQFQRRLTLMASLQQDHILPLYDYGQEEGLFYLVTRFVADGTLEEYVPDYYYPQSALRIMQPLAAALDYGHNQGLVYANLNPENILIDEGQRPMLADFAGLSGEPMITQTSNAYTSPEQMRGLPIDRRSDVFGLGALLYTLLVGEPPARDRVPTPQAYRPDLTPTLEKVILKAMAPAPEQRFQSAGEFGAALERALPSPSPATRGTQGGQVAANLDASQPPIHERMEDSRSLTGIIIALGTLALLAAVAGVYFIFFGPRDGSAVVPTAAPGVPMVTANTDVNVRAGPGPAYEVVGILRQGQNAELIGVSPDAGWWVISFPAASAGSGWISAQSVTATNTGNLPVIQPPPPPTTEPFPTEEPPTASPSTGASLATPAPILTDKPPMEATELLPPSPITGEGAGGTAGVCGTPALLLIVGRFVLAPLPVAGTAIDQTSFSPGPGQLPATALSGKRYAVAFRWPHTTV